MDNSLVVFLLSVLVLLAALCVHKVEQNRVQIKDELLQQGKEELESTNKALTHVKVELESTRQEVKQVKVELDTTKEQINILRKEMIEKDNARTKEINQIRADVEDPNKIKTESCEDIYTEDNLSPSGDYVIYPLQKAVRVYCSFEGDYGYTFISRKSSGVALNIAKLYSTNKFAKIRLLMSNGEQREVKVENLLAYRNQSTLSFQSNTHQLYQGPTTGTAQLHPFLFLGFLPKSLVQNRNIQGYRAAGKDFTFRNCDSNPNSYITFLFDPKHGTFGNLGYTNAFMNGWISSSTVMDYPKYMDNSFYMDWEMHMGGCGGLMTSKVQSIKAALGLPFAIHNE